MDNSYAHCVAELSRDFACEEEAVLFKGECVDKNQLEESSPETIGADEPNGRCQKGTYFCQSTQECVDNFSHLCPAEQLLTNYGCHKGQIYYHGHCYPPLSDHAQE